MVRRMVPGAGSGPSADAGGADSTAGANPPWAAEARRLNFGLGRLEILPGNVGYLEITGFMEAGESPEGGARLKQGQDSGRYKQPGYRDIDRHRNVARDQQAAAISVWEAQPSAGDGEFEQSLPDVTLE